MPRSLRLRLSPKARKLIKQTSLIIHGSNNASNNSNGTFTSISTDADVSDDANKVSRFTSFNCNVRKTKMLGRHNSTI